MKIKLILFFALLFCMYCSSAIADEIYLNDNKIIKCKIIQITDKNIEYSEEDGKPFLIMHKNAASKVVFDDGKIINLSVPVNFDKIVLRDSSIIECEIQQVTSEVIIYKHAASEKKEAIVRENVIKIIYANNDEVIISDSKEKELHENISEEIIYKNIELYICNGGYIDSYFRVRLMAGFGSFWGSIQNNEEDLYNNNSIYSDSYYVSNSNFLYGVDFTLLFPAMKIPQNRTFGLNGIKFGFTVIYNYIHADQDVYYDDSDDDIEDDYTIYKYKGIYAGPEINLIFGTSSNRSNLIFRFFLMGGYIFNGQLTAAGALRDEGALSVSKYDYSTSFTGSSIKTGGGIYFALNNGFPVIIGMDLIYTGSKLNYSHGLTVYGGSDNSKLHELDIIFSAGIHI